jgi:hypothetical protein
MFNPALVAMTTALVVALISFLLHRRVANEHAQKLQPHLEKANEAERQIHRRELDYLDERKALEIAHARELDQLRVASFEEGRKRGIDEREIELARKLAEQKDAFSVQLQNEKEKAAKEARDQERAEKEHQVKLFSVKISPYVQIITDKGIIYDDFETKVGYQYQLLVNGIPAFQPHVVVERHEKVKEIDQALKKQLVDFALGCAQAALATYLGANPQFATIAPTIIKDEVK